MRPARPLLVFMLMVTYVRCFGDVASGGVLRSASPASVPLADAPKRWWPTGATPPLGGSCPPPHCRHATAARAP